MTKHVDVTLQRWQVAYAMEEAERRNDYAGRIGAQGLPKKEVSFDALEAHRIGAVTELATAVYCRLPERFFDDNVLNAPDVGYIEVRGTRKIGSDLRVYAKDVDRAEFMVLAYVLDLQDAGAVIRLAGWRYSEHAWRYASDAPYSPHPRKGQARLFAASALLPMRSLMEYHRLKEEFQNERILAR